MLLSGKTEVILLVHGDGKREPGASGLLGSNGVTCALRNTRILSTSHFGVTVCSSFAVVVLSLTTTDCGG